jgi:hypothetical protein
VVGVRNASAHRKGRRKENRKPEPHGSAHRNGVGSLGASEWSQQMTAGHIDIAIGVDVALSTRSNIRRFFFWRNECE